MDNTPDWQQVNLAFPEWERAERSALAHLAPLLRIAEDDGAITEWFFIRKRPCWRVRYLPANRYGGHVSCDRELDELAAAGHITGWTKTVYEPEVHAFGGLAAMTAAHRFFHRDSQGLLAYLQHEDEGASGGHRREMSIMLCSVLMRYAGLDWYEQGDVWARVAAHRELHAASHQSRTDRLHDAVHRLITVDAEGQMSENGPLAHTEGWARAYAAAGQELGDFAASGTLHRGLRDVLTHHVIFAWNRIGLPYPAQAALAATAKTVVFGPDPSSERCAQPTATTR